MSELDQELLLTVLAAQRRHLLSAFEGLDEEQLRGSALPSGWTPLALVHHLTVDVEMWWFGAVIDGDATVRAEIEAADGWHPPDVRSSTIFQRYAEASARSDAIVRRRGLAAAPVWWPDDHPRHLDTVAEVVLHVIAETAAHAGHADAAAELIDGRQWLVLD
ncbi:DUF664 domain-containing protein [Calidifontibacter sp. DB0510]|uniref:DUF664 domain-containing protein n=1 Tax=Metallococcus carri TaxID=1656884 RepID=A0A967AYI3_9MICO|nr:DUF664 domain-containing protein [Metallococcus carri]NHN54772.1 DUF664 domain-containing protein [Metallococcus carri]NOP37117.1 DUF664 domain-containing protein [Calidifontibacter sp. DB2511S]